MRAGGAVRAGRGLAAALASRSDAQLQRSALAATQSLLVATPATTLGSGERLLHQAAYPLTRLAAAAADLPWGCQPLAQPHRRSFSAAADPQTPKQDAEGASTSGEKPAEGASAGAGTGFAGASGFASSFKGASASGILGKAKATLARAAATAVDAVKAEVRLAMMDEAEAVALRKAEREAAAGPRGPIDTTTTGIAMVKEKPKSAFGRQVDALRATAMPILDQVRSAGIFKKVGEMKQDLDDRIETSEEGTMLHRLQGVREKARVSVTPRAEAEMLIKQREPDFDIHEFVATLKGQVPDLIASYLKGDLAALRKMPIAKEMLERFTGLINASKAEGLVSDSQILDVSDLDVVEVKLLEGNPIVILQFAVQQINCARDRNGVIVEGAPDDIQSVYYLWAVEQHFDAETYTAKWMLREMVVRGMHAIT